MRHVSRTRLGITLVELMMAVLLLSVVIMTGVAMEIAMRRMVSTTDLEAQLLGEGGAILTFASKRVVSAIGDSVTSPLNRTVVGGQRETYRLRQDNNPADGDMDATDGTADFIFIINQAGVRNQLWYSRNGLAPMMLLSNRVVDFEITNPLAAGANGCAQINLNLRLIPTTAVSLTNPQVSLNSSVQVRNMALR